MPDNFPRHNCDTRSKSVNLQNVDFIGAGLMLAALTLIITGFEEASNFSPWTSAKVLAPILISAPLWIAFLIYERSVTLKDNNKPEPVFPWRFCASRIIIGIML